MAERAETRALANCRVLVVEDEYFLADDLAEALSSLGAEIVGPVAKRDEALALIEADDIDAAVLDINLRGQSVFPVADILRELGVPFVFATGYDRGAVPEAYRDVPYWEKPFRPEDLANALPGVMRQG